MLNGDVMDMAKVPCGWTASYQAPRGPAFDPVPSNRIGSRERSRCSLYKIPSLGGSELGEFSSFFPAGCRGARDPSPRV
ncbi:hypothetical protein NHX12_011096 [Muraenolepis orangiensis]|uniref:Uncharacterized protein n=1 Tax=Muraenolepis orangiensis TaxID=630683 RepID=A0A9Q0I6C2_9TELE|nr:hypothetical protein NHX12_011096 [Muraenolepis orangiensis]